MEDACGEYRRPFSFHLARFGEEPWGGLVGDSGLSWGILAREWAILGELGVKLRLCWQHGECLEHEFRDL